jgi:hypothetical protein
MNSENSHDERMFDSVDAAAFLGLKNPKTLAVWRVHGYGPTFTKMRHLVRYRHSDLIAFIEKSTVTSKYSSIYELRNGGAGSKVPMNRYDKTAATKTRKKMTRAISLLQQENNILSCLNYIKAQSSSLVFTQTLTPIKL